jgi:hypothetical protein
MPVRDQTGSVTLPKSHTSGTVGLFTLENAAGTLINSRHICKIASTHRKKPHGGLNVKTVFIISALDHLHMQYRFSPADTA